MIGVRRRCPSYRTAAETRDNKVAFHSLHLPACDRFDTKYREIRFTFDRFFVDAVGTEFFGSTVPSGKSGSEITRSNIESVRPEQDLSEPIRFTALTMAFDKIL